MFQLYVKGGVPVLPAALNCALPPFGQIVTLAPALALTGFTTTLTFALLLHPPLAVAVTV